MNVWQIHVPPMLIVKIQLDHFNVTAEPDLLETDLHVQVRSFI